MAGCAVARKVRARVAEWLAGIAATAAGKALESLVAEHPALASVLGGIAEAAPYLWDLVRADPARFPAPARQRSRCSAGRAPRRDAQRAAAAARAPAALMRILRRAKAEAALLIALADIGGVWPVAQVTRALTEVADMALGAAVRHLLREAARRGKLDAARSAPS